MTKESKNIESESEDDHRRIIRNNFSNKDERKRVTRNAPSSSPSDTDRNTQCLIKSEDKVSDSSLNSDSSDSENNNNEIPHTENNKRSLLYPNLTQFRRLSSPAVLGKREQQNKQEYFTLQDYLNKNAYVRGKSLSMQDSADMVELGTAMNYMASDIKSENNKEKKLQKVRIFFIEYCVYKLILCLPFGFLTTISILGLKGDPINFVCYIIIFTLVVFYPLACLFWLMYKLLVPYYQMCRYTPNASSTEKLPEKIEGEPEYNIPTILTEKPTVSNKSLSQTVYERRRSLPARRPSTLPAIEEDESTSENEEESEGETFHNSNEKESHVREESIDIGKDQKDV